MSKKKVISPTVSTLNEATFLNMTTFGVHWYGTLHRKRKGDFDIKGIQVNRPITHEIAQRINREDRAVMKGRCLTLYKVGDASERFFDRPTLVEAAIVIWLRDHPDSPLLIAGFDSSGPREVLAAHDAKLQAKANKLWQQFEAEWLKQSDRPAHEKIWTRKHDAICAKWDKLLRVT